MDDIREYEAQAKAELDKVTDLIAMLVYRSEEGRRACTNHYKCKCVGPDVIT